MKPDDLVICTDCVNYKYPSDYCYMEMCTNQARGYCGGCPCDGCDKDCLDFDDPKPFSDRPKFMRKDNNDKR